MQIYMQFPGIDGTGTGKYKGWIALESAQWSRNGGSKADQADILVTKYSDRATQGLFNEAFNGKPKKVTIDFVKGDQEAPYLSLELENAIITNFSTSGAGGDARTMESLNLNASKITYTAKPTSTATDAKDRVTWDLAVAP